MYCLYKRFRAFRKARFFFRVNEPDFKETGHQVRSSADLGPIWARATSEVLYPTSSGWNKSVRSQNELASS